ncbi:MAG TPA: tryptophan synthase subunit alpha [Candidatus Limiplasma sp.]|nr:tryptophan synthase subunit alpha [Candidatus Limiplasma sp.]HRX08114.1 tryptophan synthase subunit alpha [Candidatus Limiplasma sp.]
MNTIAQAFEGHKAFVAFLTCGDPDLDTTEQLILAMDKAGADLIELGVPFSDPTAEGPVIMAASERALQAGTTTDRIFQMVGSIRARVRAPLAMMTYANVVFSYGTERYLAAAQAAGIAALILPDVPFEEKAEFAPACRAHGIQFISLVAPTSKERIQMIASQAEGFVYLVSSLGVTGARAEITTDIGEMVGRIREATNLPVAVGFGISTPEQARAMAQQADGVIVGSAIVKLIAEHGKNAVEPVKAYIRAMKQAIAD